MVEELFDVQGALRAHASMGLDINVRLGEWLDNSVDAKATKIVVDVFGNKGPTGGIRITDNGRGHLVLADYLRFGRGTKEDEDVTGHFGHGMKVVSLDHAGLESSLTIDSKQGGQRLRYTLRWNKLRHNVVPQQPKLRATTLDDGTAITVHGCQGNTPNVPAMARWAEQVYQPWLRGDSSRVIEFKRNGKTIVEVKAKTLPAEKLGEVRARRSFGPNKDAELYVAAFPATQKLFSKGFNYGNADRLFEKESKNGAGEFRIKCIYGTVVLTGTGWKTDGHYTTLKTSLRDMRTVYDWVYEESRELLALADREADSIEFNSLAANLSKTFANLMTGTSGRDGGDLKKKKPKKRKKRKKPEPPTNVIPIDRKPSSRKGSDSAEEGGTLKRRPNNIPRNMIINIDRGETAPGVLYEVYYGAQSVDIMFNAKHPHVERDYADAGIMSMHVAHALADIAINDTRWRSQAFKEPEGGWAGGPEDQRRQALAELLFDWTGIITREVAE